MKHVTSQENQTLRQCHCRRSHILIRTKFFEISIQKEKASVYLNPTLCKVLLVKTHQSPREKLVAFVNHENSSWIFRRLALGRVSDFE